MGGSPPVGGGGNVGPHSPSAERRAPHPPAPPAPPHTGGSSGIGLALTRQLAAQGLNVVVAAIPDATLDAAVAALRAEFPAVAFRAVGVVLGAGDYVDVVARATADIPVTLVFNNAGYIKTGFFHSLDWRAHEANIACNATAGVALSHLFVRRMRAAGARGAIAFTSSPAGFMPSPFSCLYGATKAMVTHFATSLAAEVRADGIDVSVLHPSPVTTAFYTGAHAMPTLKFFQSTGASPDRVAAVLLAGLGRAVVVDQGYYSFWLRLLLRVLDPALFAEIVARTAHTVGDYKVLKDAAGAVARPAAGAAAAAPAAAAASDGTPRRRRNSVRG